MLVIDVVRIGFYIIQSPIPLKIINGNKVEVPTEEYNLDSNDDEKS